MMRLRKRRTPLALALLLCVLISACVPVVRAGGPALEAPQIAEFFTAADGEKLSYRSWRPDNPGHAYPPKAAIVAVHGFNDYSKAFERAARYWADRGIATYAYDQRGFGGNYPRGLWAGHETMVADLNGFATAVRNRHPGVPLYLLGTSMGGSVVIAALGSPDPPDVDGAIVVAPAAYGREVLPLPYATGLWLAAHTVPWFTVTGRGLGRVASDNIPMLLELGRDVRVIKETRIDALYGFVELNDAMLAVAPELSTPLLFLYGEKDEIVVPEATLALLDRLPDDIVTLAIYEKGYHMLLRDLPAEAVYADVASWIFNPERPLPSGADRRGLDNIKRGAIWP